MTAKGFQFAPAEAAWAEVARLRGLLSSLEWGGCDDLEKPCCPVCGLTPMEDPTTEARGWHDDSCWLAKELGR